MKSPIAQLICVAPVLVGLLSGGILTAESLDWVSPGKVRVGEVLAHDVRAPFDLELLNARETALARHAASANLPTVGVSVDEGADATTKAIQKSFEETRDRFVAEVAKVFHGYPIAHREANSSRFREFRLDFQRTNTGYPVGNLLALTWALDRDDTRLLAPILDTVEDVFDERLVVTGTDDEIQVAHGVLLVSGSPHSPGAEDRLFDSGRLVEPGGIVSVAIAREQLQADLEVTYRPVSAHVVGLLRPNVQLDKVLTDAFRDWRTQSIRVVDRFEAGEVILAAGQPVDARAQLAIREIDARVPALSALPEVAPSGVVASHPGLPAQQGTRDSSRDIHVVFLGILAFSVVLLIVIFGVFTRRQGDGGQISVATTETVTSAIPDGLAAQLAQELRDRVVQSLYSQREDLLRAEQSATLSVKQLEERLARLQPRILAKIQSFEKRIAELEYQLAQKESENQDLIRARIDEVRAKLDAELARHDIILN